MEESGYAGFIMPIEVYFKNKVGSRGSREKDTPFPEEEVEPGLHVGGVLGSVGADIPVRAPAHKAGHPSHVEAGDWGTGPWGGGWGCTWTRPARGAAGPHPRSVALQVCVGPASAVTCHVRARFHGWS